jgi:hypothetical protein
MVEEQIDVKGLLVHGHGHLTPRLISAHDKSGYHAQWQIMFNKLKALI